MVLAAYSEEDALALVRKSWDCGAAVSPKATVKIHITENIRVEDSGCAACCSEYGADCCSGSLVSIYWSRWYEVAWL